MKLNLEELERGVKDFSKEANWITSTMEGVKDYFTPAPIKSMSKALNYATGGGLTDDVFNIGKALLPMLGSMGGKASGGVPQINLNLGGKPNPFNLGSGGVKTFNSMSQGSMKMGGLLDLGLLRTVLTARTANDMVDVVKGKNIPPAANVPQPSSGENVNDLGSKQVELVSKYPEIKKILADPQSRDYLESLLTKDTAYGT
jgi:hypothetical protein